MYLKFFELAYKPFELTPDPRFLFLTPGHREALAQLTYGVQEQKGFMLMSGEVGTGKTTLLRTLMHRLDGQVDFAMIINSTLPFDEMLEYALADFGVTDPHGTRAQRLIALNEFLIRQRRAGRSTVLIVDEAQNLTIDALEQIRLLSNFETSSGKLLQIILAGQPELRAKLQLPQLRQLKQRIALRCVLRPMTELEVSEYIANHIRMAGGRRQPFAADAVRLIAQYSCGIPRVVSMVADHALLYAYADQTRDIDAAMVRRTIRYLENGEAVKGTMPPWASRARGVARSWRRVLVGCSAGVVVLGAAAAGGLSPSTYAPTMNAIATTTVTAIGGVVRLLTHWWGS